jgi:hypothetical protein
MRLRSLVATASVLSVLLAAPAVADESRPAPRLPTDASRWVGEPQSWESLRGQVTLVFVWTFG